MSTPHTRDRALEHLLRNTPPASADTTPCVDAETMAAWMDGGLDAQTMAATELHLSNCARCQAIVATVVRSEPTAPAVAPWWSRMHLRWLVPLTAAAAATVLWMVVPTENATVPRQEMTQARAERGDAPAPAAPAPGPSVGGAETGSAASTSAEPSASKPAETAAPARIGNDARKVPGASAEDRGREEIPAERQALAKQQSADTLARANEAQLQSQKETVAVTGANPAAQAKAAPAAPPPPAAVAAAADGVAGFAGSSGIAIPSRDGVARWRLTAPGPEDVGARRSADGAIERSDDGGRTWQQVSTGIQRRFIAGASPSATVCWLIGPGGTVALTTDARTWRQLAAPAPDADLTSIEAGDARTATVRDTQGRRFRTTDAGANWTRLP